MSVVLYVKGITRALILILCAVVTNGFGKAVGGFFSRKERGKKAFVRNLLLTFTSVDVLSRDVLSMAIIFLTRVFMFSEYR